MFQPQFGKFTVYSRSNWTEIHDAKAMKDLKKKCLKTWKHWITDNKDLQ